VPGQFEAGIADLLAAKTEAELAGVLRSLPPPIALTSVDRQLAEPLEIHSGTGRFAWKGDSRSPWGSITISFGST
jgi:hypothetical protein